MSGDHCGWTCSCVGSHEQSSYTALGLSMHIMITALTNCKDLKTVYCDIRHIKAWLVSILLLGIIYYPILFHFGFRYILYMCYTQYIHLQ